MCSFYMAIQRSDFPDKTPSWSHFHLPELCSQKLRLGPSGPALGCRYCWGRILAERQDQTKGRDGDVPNPQYKKESRSTVELPSTMCARRLDRKATDCTPCTILETFVISLGFYFCDFLTVFLQWWASRLLKTGKACLLHVQGNTELEAEEVTYSKPDSGGKFPRDDKSYFITGQTK